MNQKKSYTSGDTKGGKANECMPSLPQGKGAGKAMWDGSFFPGITIDTSTAMFTGTYTTSCSLQLMSKTLAHNITIDSSIVDTRYSGYTQIHNWLIPAYSARKQRIKVQLEFFLKGTA